MTRRGRVWLPLDEAAKRVGKSVRTLRRWQEAGAISIVEGYIEAVELERAEKMMRERNPALYAPPVVALARDLGIEPDVLRDELRALVMRRK